MSGWFGDSSGSKKKSGKSSGNYEIFHNGKRVGVRNSIGGANSFISSSKAVLRKMGKPVGTWTKKKAR